MATHEISIDIDYADLMAEVDYRELGDQLDYSSIEIDYNELLERVSYSELADVITYKLERSSNEDLLNKIVDRVAEKVAAILTEREKKSEEKVTQVREQLATLLEALKP